MTAVETLAGDGNFQLRMRRRYMRLSDEQRDEIESGFRRHAAMCRKIGIEPDSAWVTEAVTDAALGRYGGEVAGEI